MYPPTSVLTAFLEDEPSAQHALDEIQLAMDEGGSTIIAAAVVTLEGSARKVRLHVEPRREGIGAESEAAIERLFPASVLAVTAVGQEANAADEHFRAMGLDANLVKEIGENLTPVGAAVVVILGERWMRPITRMLEPPGVVRFSFDPGSIEVWPGV